MPSNAKQIIASRRSMILNARSDIKVKAEEEGGCGVVGFAASVPVRGRHIFEPSIQMHNRGNGKGGGIAAASLSHEQLGVSPEILKNDYILQIALLDPNVKGDLEKSSILSYFKIDHQAEVKPVADYRDVGLETKPPDVVQYFVRAKDDVLDQFAKKNGLKSLSRRAVEDEFVYRNSFQINTGYYASLGEKRAFVLSHARNLLIFKIVGYAEQVVQYYDLEDFLAQVWIAHQRYPTKGRVWHPGGAHPFIGMNEALVHNGDFANFFSVSEYLRQHNIKPLFLTDTEVSALMFDLLHRTRGYPIEYVIEALAPTTELDFDQLPDEKQRIYRAIQAMHIHGSPDGPWFFIVAQSDTDNDRFRLLGITDTSMLRPQVFAIQEGDVSIGLVASEKQAIDATLHSLAEEDSRFRLVADRYWNARGGSHTDGGAFIFTVNKNNGASGVVCSDKFGKVISAPPGNYKIEIADEPKNKKAFDHLFNYIKNASKGEGEDVERTLKNIVSAIASFDLGDLRLLFREIADIGERDDDGLEWALSLLTLLNDRRYDCGINRRSAVLQIVRESINHILGAVPLITEKDGDRFRRIDWETRTSLRAPRDYENALVIFARDFPPEGDDCHALLAVKAYKMGWKRFIVYGEKGQRFDGCSFGPDSDDVRMDIYDNSGDYLASGIDGMEMYVHNNAQDQLGQIMKRGKLVVYGDVGQAFMYGAKGGEVYIMGNAAGRPLINAAGRPRVVINGTCLDFLAESFMAGDPHKNGGFVILNGIEFDDRGNARPQPAPYPGSNLFSLASGGAIFARDPHRKIIEEQLNGGEFADMTDADWELILPYLKKNEQYFGISIERDLLTVDGVKKSPSEVYRKIRAVKLAVLAKATSPE